MRLGKPTLLLGLAFTAALGVKAVLTETADERIAILVRDGRSRDAMVAITNRLQSGKGSRALIRTLAVLQEDAGAPRAAAESRELYLLSEPHDVAALEAQVALYTALGDREGVLINLRRLVDERPTAESVSRLLALYRLHGRFLDERDLLQSLQGPPRLTVDQTERLGMLLANDGSVSAAMQALRRVDEAATDERLNARSLLFELLCRAGKYDEAASRAIGWLSAWRKPWVATRFALRLSAGAPTALASGFAEKVVSLHPETRFFLAKTFAEEGQPALGSALLRVWPTPGATPSEDDVANYLAAAVAVGDMAAVWRKYDAFARRTDWVPARAAFANGILDLFGIQALLGSGRVPNLILLATRPLFGSRFAIAIGNAPLARNLLRRVDPRTLPSAERRVWSSLVAQAFPTGMTAGTGGPHSSRTALRAWPARGEESDDNAASPGQVATFLAVSEAAEHPSPERE